jgi:Preprotein translocase subunit SecB
MTTTPGNGGPPQGQTPQEGQAQPGQPPQLQVLAQYIKDFSFENPNAPRSLAPTQTQPQINIQINVGVQQLAATDFEVTLKLDGKADMSGSSLFIFDLTFAGVFRVQTVRPRDRGDGGAQRRFPAAAARPRRFRYDVQSARGAGAGVASASGRGKLIRARRSAVRAAPAVVAETVGIANPFFPTWALRPLAPCAATVRQGSAIAPCQPDCATAWPRFGIRRRFGGRARFCYSRSSAPATQRNSLTNAWFHAGSKRLEILRG